MKSIPLGARKPVFLFELVIKLLADHKEVTASQDPQLSPLCPRELAKI